MRSLLTLPLLVAPAFAADAVESITAAEIQAHVDFLAHDLMEGRDSGHRGSILAAAYLEAQLRGLGLEPLLDTWQMPVQIKGAQGPGSGLLTIEGITRKGQSQVAVFDFSGLGRVTAPATLEGEDVKGQIVVLPGGGDEAEARVSAEDMLTRGAKAVVFVSDEEEFNFRIRPDRRRRGGGKPPAAAPPGSGGMMTAEAARELLLLSGPALRVSRFIGADLLDAAERGSEISLEVDREGVNETSNVITLIEGSDPELKDEYVVMGAHFDHVGHDELGNIWNGADDNASGTAALLEIAEALTSGALQPRRSVVLAFWGAEERGLFGSRAFATAAPIAFDDIAAYINLDMISRNEAGVVDACTASTDLLEMTKRVAGQHGLEVKEGQAQYLNASDTEPFIRESVPTVFLFTGLHVDYHAPSDDPHTIDADKAARIARTAMDILIGVANDEARPDFEAPRFQRRGSTAGGGRRRLGVYPDLTGDKVEGLRVSSVSPRSVAAKAGLEKGDIIVRIGDTAVSGLSDLRTALAAPKANEAFQIVVRRGDEDSPPVVLEAKFDG